MTWAGLTKNPKPLETAVAWDPGEDNENPFSDIGLDTKQERLSLFLWFFPSEHLKPYLLPADKSLLRMKTT